MTEYAELVAATNFSFLRGGSHGEELANKAKELGLRAIAVTDRNSFAMPFLMDVEPAARRLVAGLESNRFEIVFPRRFGALLRLLRIMPYRLAFAITKRMVPKS